jgi:hypothetical protein
LSWAKRKLRNSDGNFDAAYQEQDLSVYKVARLIESGFQRFVDKELFTAEREVYAEIRENFSACPL